MNEVTSARAEQGELGYAVALGNMIGDEWHEVNVGREILRDVANLGVDIKWSVQKWLSNR